MIERGCVVIAGERSRLGSKPRPWLVVQSDAFNPTHASIMTCMVSTSAGPPGLFRIAVEPSAANGLKQSSVVMIDVVQSLGRRSIDEVVGRLDEDTMAQVDAALRRWLDL